jgi:hypothetical protein
MPTITDGAPLAPFPFNALLAILDEQAQDTGSRCRYVGLSADRDGHLTGEAHVTLCDRKTFDRTGGINLPIYRLCLVSSLPRRPLPLGEGRGEGHMSADMQSERVTP